MTDSKDVSDALKGAGELAKVAGRIYDDLASPTARAVGSTAGALAEAILTGPKEVFFTVAQAQQWLGASVRKRLDELGISADRVQAPDPQIYAGVVGGLVTTGHVSELREMFANLLSASMDTERADFVHPSFAEIIRQLTPSEARVLKHLREHSFVLTLSIIGYNHIEGGDHSIDTNLSLLADELGIAMGALALLFENLSRLALARIWTTRRVRMQETEYRELEEDSRIQRVLNTDVYSFSRLRAERGFVEITELGTLFTSVCLDEDGFPPPFTTEPNDLEENE